MSLDIIDSNGRKYAVKSGVLRVMEGALVVLKGMKVNSSYLLQSITVTSATSLSSLGIQI